jgi:sulfur carrier protein
VRATVNGSERDVAEGTTLAQLLRDLGTATPGIAVAVNDRVVQRSAHDATTIEEGDRIEIVRAVGGGS